MIIEPGPSYDELHQRVQEFESIFDALRSHQADAIVGKESLAFIRLQKVEEALRQSEERFRLLVENVHDHALFMLDPQGRVVSWNCGAERVLGWSSGEVLGQSFVMFFSPEDREAGVPEQVLLRAREQGQSQAEGLRLRKDGSPYWTECSITALRGEGGELRGYVNICRDVTIRKQAEQYLQASLREKEILLKEIHHRVKNNLQIISSLVSLQADTLRNRPELQRVFDDVRDRVRAMALVHEKLYKSPDLTYVDLDSYIRDLVQFLGRAHRGISGGARFVLNLQPTRLPVERAVPLGLLLNELVTNALKHAFVNRPSGEITITLEHHPVSADAVDDRQSPSFSSTAATTSAATTAAATTSAVSSSAAGREFSAESPPHRPSSTGAGSPRDQAASGPLAGGNVPSQSALVNAESVAHNREQTIDSHHPPTPRDPGTSAPPSSANDPEVPTDFPQARTAGELAPNNRSPRQSQLHLTVRDNGIGLPSAASWKQAPTLGLRLIQMLTQQLNGSVEVREGNGTEFQIRFVAPDHELPDQNPS